MPVNSPTRLLRLLTILASVTVLIGCGNGRGPEPVPGTPQPSLTGSFVDSPVSGVTWKTSGGRSGVTNDAGEFEYTQPEAGTFVETVTFSIGDILLGTVPGIPFRGDRLYVTAVELTNSFAPTDRAATNMLVFIQSIDEDEDPTNGITISAATQAAAVGQNLDFDSPDFATEVAAVVAAIAPGNRVVTDTEALDHFYTTYAALGGTDTFDFPFPGYPPVGEGSADFQLVFADEFNVGDAPNPEVWNIDLGYGPNDFGWGNDEWQLYTDSPDNLRVEDGNLVITALCPVEPCGVRDGTITSARITTNDKFEFRYGKVVARIKPPVGKGTWPAFWALGKDFPDVQWPRVGEIDFMEVFNNTNNDDAQSAAAEKTATSAMHWCDETIVPNPLANCFPAGRIFVTDKLELSESLNNDFQIWEADWNADRVIISINGVEYFELDIDPRTMEEFRREFFLLLNVAMGGTLGSGGTAPTGDETYPQTMLVDYVRVFQQVDDISPPELTEVTIASNNADPAFATTGDVVTVTLTANETIVSPTVTIGGVAATTVDGSGADWQASRALTADDAEGVVEFSVEYADLAGNAGVPVSATTDSSSVTLDATAPNLPVVTIASDNANPSLATAGDIVTVTLAANEAILTPTVTIGGIAATTVDGAGANWQASRAVTDTDADGVIPFSIAYADFAGNAGVPVSTTTDASIVTVSTDAPTVTIGGAPAMFTTLAPIPVTFQFSKPVTGFDVGDIQVTNGAARNFAGGGASYTADVVPTGLGNLVIGVPAGAATDVAGNPSEAAGDVVVTSMLDPNAPLLNPISIASDNANPAYALAGETVTISMTATDAAGNPEAITQPTVTIADATMDVTVMMGADATSWVATRTALATDPEGPITFAIDNFQSVDDATPGYQSTVTTDGSTVIFDVTAPTLSIVGLPATLEFLDPLAVTFQFDEDVSGFELADIAVTNGTLGVLSEVDPATYTADITPDGVDDLTVSVAADVATDPAGNGNAGASETSVVDSAWGLVWFDDFEGGGLDAGLWTARTDADCPDPCDGAQSYLTERVTVVNGLLTIEALTGVPYTSGVIDTRDKRALKYGRVEIDAVMPGNQGALPSLRLLPAIPNGEVLPVYGPWPQSGEIDLVNAPNLGPSNSALEHALRYGLPEPEDTVTTATSDAPGIPTLDLIEYAIEWEGGEIRWFVNDVHVATQIQDNWYAYFEDADGVYTLGEDAGQPASPFDQDFYVVIDFAVGSDALFSSQTLEIDAVRVYECVNPVDPAAGTGCDTGTGVPAEMPPAPADRPYIEMVEVYTDAPATLDFVEPDGVTTTPATLAPAASGDATFSQPSDGGNIVWRVDVTSSGGVSMSTGNASRYIDLSGGETAGEILFRMRVNSASGTPMLSVGLDDRASGTGRVTLDDVAAPGVWRNYSVKIADILVASSLDIADIENIFVIEVSGGAVNLDLDDIEVKVACRDDGGCEATPRSEESAEPPVVVYSENFEALNAAAPDALSVAGFQIFADVWDGPVPTGTFLYQYGAFPAPNPGAGPGFSQLINDIDECFAGGGTQCLNAFSDYNNQDHTPGRTCGSAGGSVGCTINSSVLRDLRGLSNPIAAADIGLCWTFTGDYKAPGAGGIAGSTTAAAFIVTLDPNEVDPNTGGWAATNEDRFETTAASNTEYARFSVSVDAADPALIGQVLQIGFNTRATNFEPSGVYYDNLEVSTRSGACPAP